MFKFFLLLFSFISFSYSPASAMMDIDDPTRDPNIETKYLSRYIKNVYNSRKIYLEDKINYFNEMGQNYFEFGSVTICDPDLADEEENPVKRIYVEGCKSDLRFFSSDPFTLQIEGGGTRKLDLSNPFDLLLFYNATVKTVLSSYEILLEKKRKIRLKPIDEQICLEPLVNQDKNGLEDLAHIIQAVRPHAKHANELRSNRGALLEEADKLLKSLACLDLASQWKEIYSIKDVRKVILEAVTRGILDNKNLSHQKTPEIMEEEHAAPFVSQKLKQEKSGESNKKETQVVIVTEVRAAQNEKKENEVTETSVAIVQREPELQSIKSESKIATEAVINTSTTPQRSRRAQQRARKRARQKAQVSSIATVPSMTKVIKDEKEPTAPKKPKKTNKKHEKMNKLPEKLKTRPVHGLDYLQSLNGLFDDELPVEKAKKNLKLQTREDHLEEKEKEKKPSSFLHTSQRKILEKLLYEKNTNSINVDDSFNLLRSFGFIHEPTSRQHTSSQHFQLRTKPIELWLEGERTLIDVPEETPCVTMAVAHKSGGERYFKPYVVQRIREALFKAGIEQLLK